MCDIANTTPKNNHPAKKVAKPRPNSTASARSLNEGTTYTSAPSQDARHRVLKAPENSFDGARTVRLVTFSISLLAFSKVRSHYDEKRRVKPNARAPPPRILVHFKQSLNAGHNAIGVTKQRKYYDFN